MSIFLGIFGFIGFVLALLVLAWIVSSRKHRAVNVDTREALSSAYQHPQRADHQAPPAESTSIYIISWDDLPPSYDQVMNGKNSYKEPPKYDDFIST